MLRNPLSRLLLLVAPPCHLLCGSPCSLVLHLQRLQYCTSSGKCTLSGPPHREMWLTCPTERNPCCAGFSTWVDPGKPTSHSWHVFPLWRLTLSRTGAPSTCLTCKGLLLICSQLYNSAVSQMSACLLSLSVMSLLLPVRAQLPQLL